MTLLEICQSSLFSRKEDTDYAKGKVRGWPDDLGWLSTIADTNSTASESNMLLCSQWLRECENRHNCKNSRRDQHQYKLPLRLIDVEAVAPHVRLCKTSKMPPDVSYTTLSHCWGGLEFIKLTDATIKSFLESITWNLLPRTFQDAVMMTRRLGCRYIWIDALCIIQGNKADWNEEGVRMDEIYGGSFLNFVAAAARNGNEGLFSARDPNRIRGFEVPIKGPEFRGTKTAAFCAERISRIMMRNTEASVLMKRAWVFQEIYLAPRTLFFGPEQLFWKCRSSVTSETYPYQIPIGGLLPKCNKAENPSTGEHELDLSENLQKADSQDKLAVTICNANSLASSSEGTYKDDPPKQLIRYPLLSVNSNFASWSFRSGTEGYPQIWTGLIKAFSSGRLTYESDKLLAMSGIAKVFALESHFQSSDYLAGLWKPLLLEHLCWIQLKLQENPSHRVPSWSWASSTAGNLIFYNFQKDEFGTFKISVLEAQVELVGTEYGEVNGGWLILKCQALVKIVIFALKIRGNIHEGILKINDTEVLVERSRTRDLIHLDRIPDISLGQIYMMLVQSNDAGDLAIFMLIQAQTGPRRTFSRSNRGNYRRLGLVVAEGRHRDSGTYLTAVFREAQNNPKACASELDYMSTICQDENGMDEHVIKLI